MNILEIDGKIHIITLAEPEIFDLMRIVIPKIMYEWVHIAVALRYDIYKIEAIRVEGHGDPKECCQKFFMDWLATINGAKAGPKVWSTLLDVIKEVDEIATDITEDIIAKVKQLGGDYKPQGTYMYVISTCTHYNTSYCILLMHF